MTTQIKRRAFLKQGSVLAAGISTLGGSAMARLAGKSVNEKVLVGIIGCNGRGMAHIAGYLAEPNAEIAYVCDVDSRALERGIAAVTKKQERKPRGVKDLRQMLEDKQLDAVSIAMPDHWHAPAAILACNAGKHVYVEKPGSHNPHESELMVAAAKKHKRHVQMGNQRRSWPWVIDSIEAVKGGGIGKVFSARTWYTNHRPTIGRGKPASVPDWLDYSLWQGPAPEQAYRDNILHYNWHWFWNWGTGEIGNNGVHFLDLARWGLGVDYPRRVTCGGGRYHFDDDWQTPDTYAATFDFGDKFISWDGQSCDPRGFEGESVGVNFFGEKGCVSIAGNNCRIYDLNDKIVREIRGKGDDVLHFRNFIQAIREGEQLKSDIEDGQKSTMLCHLGNIAVRTGQTVDFDPAKKRVVANGKGEKLWRREYRKGWEPSV